MNVFELVIYAILAIILVFLIMTLFSNQNKDNLLEELKDNLKIAQTETFLGKTIKIENKTIESNFYLNKASLDEPLLSVALECNNPKLCCIRKEEQSEDYECTKQFDWDYSYINSNTQTTIKISLRCLKESTIPICRVYFGAYPAQAEIVEIKNDQEEGNNTIMSSIKVKNSGEGQLALGKLELTLQKKANNVWGNTEDVFTPQEIDYLMPGQEHTFVWAVQTATAGEYKLLYKFSGTNAGFDTKSLDYNITTTNNCKIIEEETYEIQTIQEGVKYNEIKKCENCNYAYECASAWQNKYPMVNYQIVTKEKTYCEKQTELFTCEQEAS